MSDKFGMPIIVVSEESKVKSAITEYRDEREQLRAENAALREQLAAAQKDAERYRTVKRMTMQGLQRAHEQAARPLHCGRISFDAAIDAAMQEKAE